MPPPSPAPVPSHPQAHSPHRPLGDAHAPALADLLELERALLGGWLPEAVAWTASLVAAEPQLVVDLGCGPGAGSVALAARFVGATVVAVDRSPTMLARTTSTAGPGVRTLAADLADGWPGLDRADLVWAASSLHELPDPALMIDEVAGNLAPGGLFVVVELDGLPRLLPDGRLEERVHAVLASAGWNHHPDWRPHLSRAGLDVVGQTTLTARATSGTPGTGAYADAYLQQMRTAVADALAAEDLAVLDRWLDPADPDALCHRDDLVVSSSRTAWAARRGTTAA